MRLIFFLLLATICNQLPAQQNKIYYPSGLVQYSYELKAGLLDGEFISYYDNGFVRVKGAFSNNQKTGVWQAWDTSGLLRSKRYYHNDTDVELLSEWSGSGCSLDKEKLKARNERLHVDAGLHEVYIYVQRYWKTISPDPANVELFSDDFYSLLKAEIAAGRIFLFKEERFISPIAIPKAETFMSRVPDEFLLKEQHAYAASNQRMEVRMMGLGIVYKEAAGDKIAWIYFPDLYMALKKMPLPASAIADKFKSQSFLTRLDMTTFQSRGWNPRKIEENERITITLAEIDFEAQAWIYLLDKDLLAGK